MKYKKIKLIFAFIISGKVSKKGLSKFCERQPLKNLKVYGLLKFFKGCLPQNLLSPLLNVLSQMVLIATWLNSDFLSHNLDLFLSLGDSGFS